MAFGWKPSVVIKTLNFLHVIGKGLKVAQFKATAQREST